MPQPTLLINVQPGVSNAALLGMAAHIADRLNAAVTGVAAWQPLPVDWTAGDYQPQFSDLIDRSETNTLLETAESEFRTAFPDRKSSWSSSLSFSWPSNWIIEQVRRADLVMTGVMPKGSSDAVSSVAGDLAMLAGRPVLIVPPDAVGALDSVLLAWKDTPQCRRACLDALPFFKAATRVAVVELASAADLDQARLRLVDVAGWLGRHGVISEPSAVVALADEAEQLDTVARGLDADLVVAGAWGHSRLREWMFGGVTRRLLKGPPCCALLAH